MHITDTYQINTVQSKKEIKRLKNEGRKNKTTKQIMVQSGSFTTEVGLILKAQFRRSAVQ